MDAHADDRTGETPSSSVTLVDNGDRITIRRVTTRNGVRLEICDDDSDGRIRIDPLGLESISWQKPLELAQYLGGDLERSEQAHPPAFSDGPVTSLGEFTLLNEFSEVKVRCLRIKERDVVEIVAPKAGHEIRLPLSVLVAMSKHDTGFLSMFLQTPYGPEDH